MTITYSEFEFESDAEAASYLEILRYVQFPGTAGFTQVADGFDDFGNETITFARKCYSSPGEPIKWQFAELIKRGQGIA